jgi:hypothetical protein
MATEQMKGPGPDMPPANTGSGPESDDKTQEMQTERYEGLLRQLRAECQDLRESFLEIIKKNDGANANTCCIETPEMHESIFRQSSRDIDQILVKVHEFSDECTAFYSKSADSITHIENRWERVKEIHPSYSNPPANICDILKKSSEYLCEIIYYCDRLTVPRRVKLHMESLKPGYALDFHEEFDDEFCSKEQASELLRFLARHPAYLQGIVDAENGRIFKADPKGMRWPSYFRIFGAAFLGGLITLLAITIFKGELKLPVMDTLLYMSQYALPFILILGGAVAHIIVGAVKESQSETKHPLKAVDDWLLWVHIKETLILRGIAVICIGFGVIVVTFAPTETLTYFIAGYSVDSIGDILVNKFDTVLTDKADELKKKIGT